jgi:hypothetical protein
MIEKTKQDMSALSQQNYCLQKREKYLLKSHREHLKVMEQGNDTLRKENERMEMKLDSLEKAYLVNQQMCVHSMNQMRNYQRHTRS